ARPPRPAPAVRRRRRLAAHRLGRGLPAQRVQQHVDAGEPARPGDLRRPGLRAGELVALRLRRADPRRAPGALRILKEPAAMSSPFFHTWSDQRSARGREVTGGEGAWFTTGDG